MLCWAEVLLWKRREKLKWSDMLFVKAGMTLLSEEELVDTCSDMGPANSCCEEYHFCFTPPTLRVAAGDPGSRSAGDEEQVTRAKTGSGSAEQLQWCTALARRHGVASSLFL